MASSQRAACEADYWEVGIAMRQSTIIAGLIALAAIVWMASGLLTGEAAEEAGPADAEATRLPQVRVITLSASQQTQSLTLQGETEADSHVAIAARTAGEVIETAVAKGDQVAEGTVLVRLAIEDRAAALAEAEALVSQRELEFAAAQELGERGFRSEVGRAESAFQLEQARAALTRARLDFERATVTAPISGMVNAVPVDIGDYVRVGEAVAEIVRLDPIIIAADVSERDVGSLALGASAMVSMFGRERFAAEVRFIDTIADPATRTFRVELAAPNPDRSIRAGMSAEIEISTRKRAAHRVSPAVLSLADDGTIGVKLVTADNIVRFTPVELLSDSPQGIWVAGLPEDVRLISVGGEFVEHGQKVRVVDAATLDARRP